MSEQRSVHLYTVRKVSSGKDRHLVQTKGQGLLSHRVYPPLVAAVKVNHIVNDNYSPADVPTKFTSAGKHLRP